MTNKMIKKLLIFVFALSILMPVYGGGVGLKSTVIVQGLRAQMDKNGNFKHIRINDSDVPDTPDSGEGVIYEKASDGNLYFKNDTGTEFDLTQGAGSGDNVSVNGGATVDPDFISTGNVGFTNTSNSITANLSTNSAGMLAAISDETGTGLSVFNTAPTFETSILGNYLTASEILITDGSKKIVSAPVATYPSLTELIYLKGVTNSIQTQLDSKGTSNVSQLSDLSDVGVTTATDKNALMADGDSWESRAIVEADISDLGSYITASDTVTLTNKVFDADGTGNSITNIENADIKAAAGIAVNKLAALTASEIAITDGSGFLASAAVATYPSLTELAYMKGVTSAVQTQLDAKLTSSGIDTFAELDAIVTDESLVGTTTINTSAKVAGIVADETGSGALVFGTSPTLTTSDLTGTTTADSIDFDDNEIIEAKIKDYSETLVEANTGSAYTINLNNGNTFNLTLTDNCTFTFSNPPASGSMGSFTLLLRQDGTGGRTTTWPGSVDWAGGSAPTLTTAISAVDILVFITIDGGTIWHGMLGSADSK